MSFYKNKVVQDDLTYISQLNLDFEKFRNKRILITGINGMLATYLAYTFLFLNEKFNLNIKIVGLGRNKDEFRKRFDANLVGISFLGQDINDKIQIKEHVDYVFHAATNANPENMIKHPVSIALANTLGTINVAKFALQNHAQVHLFSTREVYGENTSEKISEASDSRLNAQNVRDVYPISKLSAESILLAYKNEYNLDISISRIAHAFGPGMKIQNDGRVMADFLGKVIRNENILLKSEGLAERAFIYVRDAIIGILVIILKHTLDNFVFNLSNETEPLTVRQLADLVQQCGQNYGLNSRIILKKESNANNGYSKNKRVPLNTQKLEGLGWEPSVSLKLGIYNTLGFYNKFKGK